MSNNKNLKQSLWFVLLVIGLSYFVFWGPIPIFTINLKVACLLNSQVSRTPTYNTVECLPSLIIGCIFVLLVKRQKIALKGENDE